MEKICLLIMDGYGINEKTKSHKCLNDCGSLLTAKSQARISIPTVTEGAQSDSDAVATSTHKKFRKLVMKYPHTMLFASGEHVGLPSNQMGNSEVGHLNIGAGRVVLQSLMQVDQQIKDKSFYGNSILQKAVNVGTENAVHLIGLCSSGGVHSSLKHLFALITMCKESNAGKIFVHFISDGRDTPVNSAIDFARQTELKIKELYKEKDRAVIASLSGRYFAMDREKNWDRTNKFWSAISEDVCDKREHSITKTIKENYAKGVTDEFIEPTLFTDSYVKDGDSLILYNLRADRMRQLSDVAIKSKKKINITSFVPLDEMYGKKISVVFEKDMPETTLSKVISEKGLKQLKVAETTKYAHVTYFLNGGIEKPYENEDRVLVDMVKVPTYDLKPQMSAKQVAKNVKLGYKKGYDFICANLANCDMVGHSGNMKATEIAVNLVTKLSAELALLGKKYGYTTIITADHGNAEQMKKGNDICTTHTMNRVPFVVVTEKEIKLKNGGALCNIMPTVLELMFN